MATRPTQYPQWPLTGPNVNPPSSELSATGWAPGIAPDALVFNWLLGDNNAWIQYLDQLTNTGLPLSVIRLINGGTWTFNATSGVLAWSADFNLAIPPLTDASNDIPAGSVTLADGQVAYVNANLPTTSLGNTSTTVNPTEITSMNYTGNVSVGMAVTGPGIPASTTVLGVGSNYVTLSQSVTSNNTQAQYTFAPVGSLSVTVVNNTAFNPTLGTILIARRAGNVVYLGVNAPQMVIRDGESKTLQGYGYFSVYQAPAGQNLTAGQLVYLSPGSMDGGRTAGAAYLLDTSSANQSVRGVYAGVVITGVSATATATIVYSGFYTSSGLTPGDTYYSDPTNPGGITATQPSGAGQKIEPVGFAVTSTIILFTGVAAGVSGPSQYPIFFEEEQYGNAVKTAFTLANTPISSGGLYVFIDGLVIPNSKWSYAGGIVTFNSAPALASVVEFKYILAGQAYLAGGQETPSNPSGDRKTYTLVGNPVNASSTFVWVDGQVVPSSLWALSTGGGPSEIIFNAALAIGQSAYVSYFQSASSGVGSITSVQNLGGGTGLFAQISSTIAQFLSLAAGSNITLTATSTTVTIAAKGGGTWNQETLGTGNGVTTVFNTTHAPQQALGLILNLDGLTLRQGVGLDYTISGTTITMAAAPANGQVLYAVYQY